MVFGSQKTSESEENCESLYEHSSNPPLRSNARFLALNLDKVRVLQELAPAQKDSSSLNQPPT